MSKHVSTENASVTLPAVAYLTEAGKRYYNRSEDPFAVGFELELAFDDDCLGYPAAVGRAVYERVKVPEENARFLNGNLRFYRFKTSDPPPGEEPVHRIGVLGLGRRGQVGFYRELDLLGGRYPDPRELDFETFASCESPRHEIVIEAGSPTALA